MPFTHRNIVEVIARLAISVGLVFLCQMDSCAQIQPEDEEFPLRIDGDIGLGAYYIGSIIYGKTESANILPYVNFDYGRLFARIDTFGVKTSKMGYGYLELSGQVKLDGFKTDTNSLRSFNKRKDPLPLGVSTIQETPIGALYVTAFHDVKESRGNLFDVTYIGKLTAQKITIYPQFGAEYLSKQYVGYYYGVSTREASNGRFSRYLPGSALNPFVAAMFEIQVAEDWKFNSLIRHSWLANSITNSPIVDRRGVNNFFVSLAYLFK